MAIKTRRPYRPYRSGSLRERGRNRWELRYRDQNGKRLTETIGAESREIAELELFRRTLVRRREHMAQGQTRPGQWQEFLRETIETAKLALANTKDSQ